MKLPTTQTAWSRLLAAARLAPPPDAAVAPPGFATRVAALAFSRRPVSLATLCELFSWRALAAAALIALVSVAANLKPILNPAEDTPLAISDPVAEVLSLT